MKRGLYLVLFLVHKKIQWILCPHITFLTAPIYSDLFFLILFVIVEL